MILAAEDRARELSERPAWIRGIDHRIDAHGLGVRDLTRSESTRLAGEKAGVGDGPVDIAELHAPFTSPGADRARASSAWTTSVTVNPSGGPLAANPMMAAGLIRLGEAARASAGASPTEPSPTPPPAPASSRTSSPSWKAS